MILGIEFNGKLDRIVTLAYLYVFVSPGANLDRECQDFFPMVLPDVIQVSRKAQLFKELLVLLLWVLKRSWIEVLLLDTLLLLLLYRLHLLVLVLLVLYELLHLLANIVLLRVLLQWHAPVLLLAILLK